MKVSIGAVIDCSTGRIETAEKVSVVSVTEIKRQDRIGGSHSVCSAVCKAVRI